MRAARATMPERARQSGLHQDGVGVVGAASCIHPIATFIPWLWFFHAFIVFGRGDCLFIHSHDTGWLYVTGDVLLVPLLCYILSCLIATMIEGGIHNHPPNARFREQSRCKAKAKKDHTRAVEWDKASYDQQAWIVKSHKMQPFRSGTEISSLFWNNLPWDHLLWDTMRRNLLYGSHD